MSRLTPFLKKVGLFNALLPFKRFYDLRVLHRKYGADFRRLRELKDCHKGEKCFLVATGPSLTVEDVQALSGEITFGVNSCFRLFERTGWKPKYYGCVDSRVFADIRDEVLEKQLDTVFVIDRTDGPFRCKQKFLIPGNTRGLLWRFSSLPDRFPRLFPWAYFSKDIEKNVFLARTVIYALLQVAVYMGFSEIYLIGVDCDYTGQKTHADLLNYKKGKWNNFDGRDKAQTGEDMIRSFEVAQKFAEKHGVKIYNATRGGKLEAFPRRTLEQALGKEPV